MSERLTTDNYERPKKTYTEKLTPKDIREKLKGYREVTSANIKVGDHVRYFVKREGKYLFRMGGAVKKVAHPKYFVLTNGKQTWSAQVGGSKFFVKLSEQEATLATYKKEIRELKKELALHKKEAKTQTMPTAIVAVGKTAATAITPTPKPKASDKGEGKGKAKAKVKVKGKGGGLGEPSFVG